MYHTVYVIGSQGKHHLSDQIRPGLRPFQDISPLLEWVGSGKATPGLMVWGAISYDVSAVGTGYCQRNIVILAKRYQYFMCNIWTIYPAILHVVPMRWHTSICCESAFASVYRLIRRTLKILCFVLSPEILVVCLIEKSGTWETPELKCCQNPSSILTDLKHHFSEIWHDIPLMAHRGTQKQFFTIHQTYIEAFLYYIERKRYLQLKFLIEATLSTEIEKSCEVCWDG